MTATAIRVDNGVNVEALLGARAALTEAPEAAHFKWRATCDWVRGTHSRSTVQGFFGLGTEQSRNKTFHYDADHPELFAAEDNGATPVEYVLVALASCLTAGIASVAQTATFSCVRSKPRWKPAWTCRASLESTARYATASTASR